MESDAPGSTMAENNPLTNKTPHHEMMPMETDENADSTLDASEQNMDTDNIRNDEQSLENLSSSNAEAAGHMSSQPEQLDTSHDNLATLAAVSAAGVEANAKSTQSQSVEALSAGNLQKVEEKNKITTNSNVNNNPPPGTGQTINPPLDEEDAKWHTVGIFQGLSTTVTSYIDNTVWSSAGLNLNSEDIPELTQHTRINLEPGTAYRFRIRALNSVGASDWSEISSFKTCLPGFPGAPSAIKISKSSEGAHLTWEPPPSCVSSNEIVEYSVYLAVKPGKEKEAKAGQRAPAQLAFVRVYVGATNQCTVSHSSLSAAHVDCSNKPAIIFRIAARNEKGYGPATQVRWLQDPVQNSSTPGMGPNSLLSPTRVKPELVGASPNKRFKTVGGGGR